jgi:uncharacterized membrane protein YccC
MNVRPPAPVLNRLSIEHAARTTVAAAGSFAVAKALHFSEPQWAAISTIVVTQSTLGAALTISGQRFAGTLLGSLAGALLATWLGWGILPFASGLLSLGLVCALLRLDRAAYRFAGITLAIVVLTPSAVAPWLTAVHRFLEVSLGIVVGLLITTIWREPEPESNAK